jgi:hypothetical protein
MIWEILELVVKDWQREATTFQEAITAAANENERLLFVTKAFYGLQPCYLKCLFSYAVFFIALVGAYDRFYEELNSINRKPFFQVRHDKKPKPTAYVNKVRKIRNISIVHIGSTKDTEINSAAAMMWQPMTLGKGADELWDINKMTFGEMKLTLHDSNGKVINQSGDLEIKGILEMDRFCKSYLDEYDRVCATYLKTIHTKLPITMNDENYYALK